MSVASTRSLIDLAEDVLRGDVTRDSLTARVWVEVDGVREGAASSTPVVRRLGSRSRSHSGSGFRAHGRYSDSDDGSNRHRRRRRSLSDDEGSAVDGAATVKAPRGAPVDACDVVVAVYAKRKHDDPYRYSPTRRGGGRRGGGRRGWRSDDGSDDDSTRGVELGRAALPLSRAMRASRGSHGRSRPTELSLRPRHAVSSSVGSASASVLVAVSSPGRHSPSRRPAGSGASSRAARSTLRKLGRQLASLPGGLATLTTHLHSSAVRVGGDQGLASVSALADALRRVDVDASGPALDGLVAWLRVRERNGALNKPLEWSAGESDDEDVHSDTEFDYHNLCRLLASADTAGPGVGGVGMGGAQPITDPAVAAIVRGLRSAAASGQEPLDRVLPMYDRTGSGRITTDDLLTCLRRMGCQVTHSDVLPALVQLGVLVDGFGKVEWRQFSNAIRKYVPAELSSAEQLLRMRVRESAWFTNNYLDFRAPFAAADVSGRGRLTPQQFHEAVSRLGVPMSLAEVNSLMSRLDTNFDGTIDYYEFAKLIDLDPAEVCVCALFCCCFSKSRGGGDFVCLGRC